MTCLWLSYETAHGDAKTRVYSPDKKFYCEITSRENLPTGQAVHFRMESPSIDQQLLETGRWAEVIWAPASTHFAMIDHFDGQASTLTVYRVIQTLTDRTVKLQQAYQSPRPGALGVEWVIEGWLSSGSAFTLLRKQVLPRLPGQYKHPATEKFVVPLE